MAKTTNNAAVAAKPIESIEQETDKQGDSIWRIYARRFRKHTLGKIGLGILAVLYLIAIFAEFFSPFDMTWGDRQKPYHPPTNVKLFYTNPDGSRTLRPWVYEQRVVDLAQRSYGVIPERSLRVVSIGRRTIDVEFRALTDGRSASERADAILAAVSRQYRLAEGDVALTELSNAIDRIERDPDPDARYRVQIGSRMEDGDEVPVEVWLVKGNKNFVRFFGEGIPFRFLGLFTAKRHLFTSPTGGYFPLGTDTVGRDIMSRLWYGSRISLTVGLLGAAITFTIGLLIGGIAGYAGGAVDNILMRMTEVLISTPSIYLLFALRAAFPPDLTSVQVYILIILVVSFIGWAGLARIIRGLVLRIKSEDYVMAARTTGLSHLKVIRKHVLPNTFSFVIVQVTLSIPGYILGESALSLLGLGITEPQSSWGLMLAVGRNYRVVNDFPWVLIPGIFIFLAILAWNFFGDGIRDSVDPRSKH